MPSDPPISATFDSMPDVSTVLIGRDTPLLPPGPVVYRGPVVVSQGPAAAFVPGVGLIGTIGGDADRNFDLAVVSDPTAAMIGVRVTFTPTLTGASDGRLYVVDGSLSAYSFSAGKATRTAGPIDVGTGCKTIDVTTTDVVCGQASIALGPVVDSMRWTTTNLDHVELSHLAFIGVTDDCTTFYIPGCETWTLANGSQLWALQIEWHDSGNNYSRSALITRVGGRSSTVLIDGLVAGFDPAESVLYAWRTTSDLVTYDLSSLMSS